MEAETKKTTKKLLELKAKIETKKIRREWFYRLHQVTVI